MMRIAIVSLVALSLLVPVAQARVTSQQAQQRKQMICHVFGSHCTEAVRVAWCESKYDVDARNGQYIGIFQMGTHERATYQHGFGGWAQVRAAYSYFKASGWGWSRWECKP